MSKPKKPASEAAIHTAFSWLVPELKDNDDAQFAALVMDLCEGVATCLELAIQATLSATAIRVPARRTRYGLY